MKKLIVLAIFTLSLIACKEKKESNETVQSEKTTVTENNNVEQKQAEKFDINKLPISEENIGDFPFFSAPEGTKYMNNVKPKDFDFIVVVTPDDIFEVEGKTFCAYVQQDEEGNKEISNRYLLKSYEDAIQKAGGIKVFEGKLEGERKEKYINLCTYAGLDGSIDIYNNPIITYAIHKNDGNVYIAIDKAKYGGISIQIVQEKGFEQTIKFIKSDKIQKDLEETGKSVLHINFDTDKATLKPDGISAVNEIVTVLKNLPDMKIEINGYTDNTGNEGHNLKLSEERASTVKNEIIIAGIDQNRLISHGYGQNNPIADNSSEEGKAQNRRVELIKISGK
ncbi:OmpA family protein [Tenacibaculum sp.]|uniref:OmpA family protein n=1 Tax=Tenacibaculum sp. TaxID=1906242 RepID=UPI003D0A6195